MALPHLPSTYTTRKNIYEAAIVHRRTHENDFRENWMSNSNYFHRNNVAAEKKKYWESKSSFQNSMDAYQAEKDKETKKLNLERRRRKLAEMLKIERESYKAELGGLSGDNYSRIEEMKDRSETLKSAREEKRKKLADELMYEHWRSNNPDIRQLEQNQHQEHVIDEWSGQVTARKQEEEAARLEKELFEQKLEEERLAALELEREKEMVKIKEEKALKAVLKKQMVELKAKEAESERLKKQEDMLMAEQWELENMEEERAFRENERKKSEHGRILLRQHAAALRRRSHMVQQELEEDLAYLRRLEEQEEEDKVVQTSRKEKQKADAEWMRQVVEEQLRLEKAREAELDMLYQDEAAKIWQEREAEWNKERAARERLMKEVLSERANQVQDKLDQVRRGQEESLRQREELILELELANQMTQRDIENEEAAKTERKQQLEAQMTSRKDQERMAVDEYRRQLEEDRKAEEEYEEMLRQEAERLTVRGFEGKNFGRRQAWK